MQQLGAGVLFRRHTEQRPALDGRVIADEHATAAADLPNPGNNCRTRRNPVVHPLAGQIAEIEKGRTGIDEPRDAFPRQQLPTRCMQARALALPPGACEARRSGPGQIMRAIELEFGRFCRDSGCHHGKLESPKLIASQ